MKKDHLLNLLNDIITNISSDESTKTHELGVKLSLEKIENSINITPDALDDPEYTFTSGQNP